MNTIIAGVDIGNSTTEVTLARINGSAGEREFLSSALCDTTGVKGTIANVKGIVEAINIAAAKVGISINAISQIRLNEATPVISQTAMETISETAIIGSAMIGHNPDTPGGRGIATGNTVLLENAASARSGDVVVVVDNKWDFENVATTINNAVVNGIKIVGAIVQKDDGVLIENRLKSIIPIVDEVRYIEKIPLDKPCAIEVAGYGETVKVLSNPYGLAGLFNLSPSETKDIIPISRSMIGNRSGVVIKTENGSVRNNKIPAGKIKFVGNDTQTWVDVMEGAQSIMKTRDEFSYLMDVFGEVNTNVGKMLGNVRSVMSKLTGIEKEEIRIKDVLAVDTFVPVSVSGAIADEYAMENAVLLAAMVQTSRLPMETIAEAVKTITKIDVVIAGKEANMALLGALTTPGTDKPLAILDMGGGSTDAAFTSSEDAVKSVHLSGAGELVTMIINSELNIGNRDVAELIKKYPLAKVETLLTLRFEDGTVRFCQTPMDPDFFARVVIVTEDKLIPIRASSKLTLEKVRLVRRQAKKRVFVTNAIRALKAVAPKGNIRNIDFVVMVGGSALDFEIPEMISESLADYRIVAGQGNIRGSEGARNAVATGLVLS